LARDGSGIRQRLVELTRQLLLHDDVHDRGGTHRSERDSAGGEKGNANAEGHASLNT
jgi:hypothetical protein